LDDVVVAQRGVELHTGLEQVFVRLFEARFDVFRLAFCVDVVAEHDRELEGRLFALPKHLAGDGELRLVARAGVADDGEGDDRFGAILVLRRRDKWERQQQQPEENRTEILNSRNSACHLLWFTFSRLRISATEVTEITGDIMTSL